MSFRIEEKVLLERNDLLKIKEFIFKNNGGILHPNRKISSIYFDNKNLQSFRDSDDGCLPRKKIRIRSYNNFQDNVLEKKITSVEGKFKKSFKVLKKDVKKNLDNGMYDTMYGLIYPLTKISYYRHYFHIEKSIRITIDYDITYQSYNNKIQFFKDYNKLILEVKSNSPGTVKNLENLIPLRRVRFSKYCSSIENLMAKNHMQRLQPNL